VARPANAPWANFPTSPEDLATNKPYQYLAGRLLAAGFVKAPDCPGGGFTASGAPNTCGLDAAAPAVIEWQNQFDVSIWSSARMFGIPPRLLKALFEQESQFWPGNSIRALYEFGLGQISPNGADVALRWDPELFASTCNGVLFDCSRSFGRMTPALQATMRGWMTTTLNAECPTCANGINMQAAFDSIPVFTRTLRSNCYQVKYLMDQKGLTSSYEDLWKFTFLSYHSGYNCLSDALTLTAFNEKTIDWPTLTGYLKCEGGKTYVDSLWNSLQMFDQYRLQTPAVPKPVTQPTFQPTPLPTRTPTPILAMSHIRVLVYVDKNGNNYPEQDERVDGAKVTVTFPDNQVITTTTTKGEAVFDMTGRPVGIDVTVALPELYRSQRVRVMRDGEIPVVFRLEPPVVPPVLP
jgi:hypothetical protein